MQRFFQLASNLSSPALLIVVVWFATLIFVAVGPIDYPGQPSLVVLTTVGTGLVIFLLGYGGGVFAFDSWFARRGPVPAPSARVLNRAIVVTSLIGIAGIGFVALDRMVLSGVSNGQYSELLRCAPGLINAITIKRTPILYLGYVMFSFGFVSIVLFLLRGEFIRGWAAALAQLSIVSPVGYALLYAGRTPILFILVLVIAAMLVRIGEGRSALPSGHRLVLKTIIAVGLFAIYSSAMWSSRQNFCIQLTPLIRELEEKQRNVARLPDQAPPKRAVPEGGQATASQPVEPKVTSPSGTGPAAVEFNPVEPKAVQPKPTEVITATDLSKQMAEATAAPAPPPQVNSADAVLAVMQESWNVKPRAYVIALLESAHLSAGATMAGLNTYFYLTHGVRVIDVTWGARETFSPQMGVYQIGVLSPIIRVFFPGSQRTATLEDEQRSAGTYGFFPTVWVAGFIDFGMVGAIIYILCWGCMGGWSAAGAKRSSLVTPQLLLVFVIATVLLSLMQGPLGISNSALVLVSMLATGGVLDFASLRRRGAQQDTQHLQLNRSAT